MSNIKFFSLSLFFLLISCEVYSQAYGTAIGLRVGDGIGATLQQQIQLHTTIEAILQSSGETKKDVTLSLLGEQHHNILFKGFNFYTGGGLYYTWIQQDSNLKVQPGNPLGITGIVGLEIKLGKLVFSTDVKPSLRIAGDGGKTFEWHTGISVRYVIADRFFRNDGWMFWKKKKKKYSL